LASFSFRGRKLAGLAVYRRVSSPGWPDRRGRGRAWRSRFRFTYLGHWTWSGGPLVL